uniref:Uncharacterized protein n=1 Tax=Hucho hucho TaxID=62062 RepID=A0A4W5RXS1_9TELE
MKASEAYTKSLGCSSCCYLMEVLHPLISASTLLVTCCLSSQATFFCLFIGYFRVLLFLTHVLFLKKKGWHSKAKKIMGLVSGKSPETEGGASMSFRPKKSKRKLYRPEISSPMDFPSHPIIGGIPDEKEGDHLIIKRKLRTRTAK